MNHALHRPGGLLQGLVACFWYWQGAPQGHAQEQLMPNGEAGIVFNLREDPIRIYESRHRGCFQSYGCVVLSGPRTRPFVIDSAQQERVFGIQFLPGGSWPFFQIPASELANQSVALDDLWSTSAHHLREKLLLAPSPAAMFALAEKHLLNTLARGEESHAAIRYAVRSFTRSPQNISVAALADRIGLSHRRFGQLFLQHVGLSPKAFCRVRRFQHVLNRVHRQSQVDWTQLALDCGYYDQPHFNHDFREFSGFTPGEYLIRATEHLNHVPLD